MLAPEVIHNLELHLECINRQHTPECNRDCVNCNVAVTKSVTAEALETALKVLRYVEKLRKEKGNAEG